MRGRYQLVSGQIAAIRQTSEQLPERLRHDFLLKVNSVLTVSVARGRFTTNTLVAKIIDAALREISGAA